MVILKKDGQPAFAILPYDEYQALVSAQNALNEMRDSHAMRIKRRAELPAEMTERLKAGDNPIRVWREHRGLKQKELAAEIGITAPYLSQLEKGDRKGSVDVLRRLAVYLHLDLEDLEEQTAP